MKIQTTVLSAAAALTCVLAVPAFAQAPDADIQSLLAQVAGAYRNLPALSTTLELSQGSGAAASKATTKLVFKRPNLVAATIVRGEGCHQVHQSSRRRLHGIDQCSGT